jgi:hypothetical protein
MARRITSTLTDDLFQPLNGDIESRATHAILICTVNADGSPHPAMLSYFEVGAIDRESVRLAVYSNSRTCANMRERRKAALIVVEEGLACYITGDAVELAAAMRTAGYNAKFRLHVRQVVFDEPPPDLEPGAFITSGVTYKPRTGDALARAVAVRAELLER